MRSLDDFLREVAGSNAMSHAHGDLLLPTHGPGWLQLKITLDFLYFIKLL